MIAQLERPRLQTKDISDYYSVRNELGFLERFGKKLKPEEQFFYLVENQLRFLGEFVGRLKFSKINYLLNERNGFNFAGLRMIDMLNYTTDFAGDGREIYENLGLAQIFKSYETDYQSGQHKLKNAAILSPPKDWDYSYLFYYDRKYDPFLGEDVVTMYPLRYDEKRYQLENSRKILAKITRGQPVGYDTTEDYLTKPFLSGVPSLQDTMAIAGINDADIKESEYFEEAMKSEVGPEIALYAQGIIELYGSRYKSFELNKKLEFLELLRRAIFNKAKEVWAGKPLVRQVESFTQPSSSPAPINLEKIYYYAEQQPTTIVGGGSCPVSNSSSSNSEFANQILKGHSIENTIASLSNSEVDPKKDPGLCHCGKPPDAHFHCPGKKGVECNHPIIVGEHTTKCPNPACGLDATCP